MKANYKNFFTKQTELTKPKQPQEQAPVQEPVQAIPDVAQTPAQVIEQIIEPMARQTPVQEPEEMLEPQTELAQEILQATQELIQVPVQEPAPQQAAPVIIQVGANQPPPQPVEIPSASDMVEQAFNQAIVATVKNEEKVQKELLESAEKVIHNKTSEIKAKAETEEKAAHFNNKKSACECFGYNEETTEKWAVSAMGIWHNIITAIWIFLGMFTFAPITFVAKKISVIVKRTWLAIVIAILIYAAITTAPLWLSLISRIGG